MEKGKAYANRTANYKFNDSDYYPTPKSLVWKLVETGVLDKKQTIYEPAAGDGSITLALRDSGFTVYEDDIRTTGKDFLTNESYNSQIVTNPPFSLFDEFVEKAKESADLVVFIAKTNFFGAYKRWDKGVWKNLRDIYVFNRQVDYRTPVRDDGQFHVGNLITGWFVWDKKWTENYWRTQIINVQDYATLGQFKE